MLFRSGLYTRKPGVPEAVAAIGAGVTTLVSVSLAGEAGMVSSAVARSATGMGIVASAVVFLLVLLVRRPGTRTSDPSHV